MVEKNTCLKCVVILLDTHLGSLNIEEPGYYQFKTKSNMYANKMEEGVSHKVQQFRMKCRQYQKALGGTVTTLNRKLCWDIKY